MSEKRELTCPLCGACSYTSDWQYCEEIKCYTCNADLRVIIDKEVIIKSVSLEPIEVCTCDCQCRKCKDGKP